MLLDSSTVNVELAAAVLNVADGKVAVEKLGSRGGPARGEMHLETFNSLIVSRRN